MYTHCPHCDTFFRITSTQLKSANGDVRCGRCFGTFNAIKNLADEPPATTDNNQDEEQASISENQDAIENSDTATQTETTAETNQSDKETIKHEHSQQLIEEFQGHTTTNQGSSKRLGWTLLSLPLAALLVLQYAHLNLNQLSQNASYRPALESLCSLTGCQVPLLKSPQKIKLAQRDIRAHEKKKNVLVVKAMIINQADATQAFPMLQLSMQDITGHTMTGRRFLPSEYLVDNSNIGTGIGAKQSHQILLELIDPGKEAVGFEFEFL